MPRPPLSDGGTFDIGPYRLAHRIAVGGMAEVYRALWPQQAGGDRAVVIKRLLPALVEDEEQRAMFEHEARLGMRIVHPNVVSVLDRGVHDGAPYLVLEYVFGVDLWRLMRWTSWRERTMSIPLAVWIGHELLRGLEAVHAVTDGEGHPLHVVHRDVSPSNVFLSVHGDVKLGDLGIARAMVGKGGKGRREGRQGLAKGKLGYLSPEQVSGREVDQRGDVFAASVVIAELLMGRALFTGATELAVLLAIRDGDVSGFRALRGELPEGLAEVVLGGLEPAPEARTPSAAALREGLRRFVAEDPSALQQELGSLVVAALDEQGSAADRTSLARTIEKPIEWVATPAAEARPPSEPPPEVRYRVRRGAEALGHYTMAELVREITTGRIGPTDQVSSPGGAPRAVAAIRELSRHLPSSTRTPTARRRTQMAQTNELFDLSARSMLAVLIDSLLLREDGLLLCERGPVRKEVYLERGVPTFVTSNLPEELLGETLVRQGVIDRAELDMALAVMPRFEGRLGETLVALGLVDAIQLFSQMGGQVREKLLDLFLWDAGHAALYCGVEPPERAFPMQLDPWALFLEGARRRIEAGLEQGRFSKHHHDALVRSGSRVVEDDLSSGLSAVWAACTAPRSLAELEGTMADPVDARAGVLVLLELGALRWQSRAGTA